MARARVSISPEGTYAKVVPQKRCLAAIFPAFLALPLLAAGCGDSNYPVSSMEVSGPSGPLPLTVSSNPAIAYDAARGRPTAVPSVHGPRKRRECVSTWDPANAAHGVGPAETAPGLFVAPQLRRPPGGSSPWPSASRKTIERTFLFSGATP
jgi:hypothetical protein